MIEDAHETVEGSSETIEQRSGEASGDGQDDGSGALLGLELPTIEKSGQNPALDEDSIPSSAIFPLLGTIFSVISDTYPTLRGQRRIWPAIRPSSIRAKRSRVPPCAASLAASTFCVALAYGQMPIFIAGNGNALGWIAAAALWRIGYAPLQN
jgi:hypothetical protein